MLGQGSIANKNKIKVSGLFCMSEGLGFSQFITQLIVSRRVEEVHRLLKRFDGQIYVLLSL